MIKTIAYTTRNQRYLLFFRNSNKLSNITTPLTDQNSYITEQSYQELDREQILS